MKFYEPQDRTPLRNAERGWASSCSNTASMQEVTVNEQNPQAVGFYEHMGFRTYKRTDLDEEGNPYPLLYMKLVSAER